MRALNCAVAVLAPAFPAAGRVTRRGQCYVHGLPVNETEFATDPKTPVGSADIATVVAQQSDLLCHGTTVSELAAELGKAVETPRVLIVDAEENQQLDAIIARVAMCEQRVLLVGSAGLCDALARRLAAMPHGPLLAMVGSMSEIAQQQVVRLNEHPRVRRVDIDVAMAFGGDAALDARRIVAVLSENHHCVVTTRPDSAARKGLKPCVVGMGSIAPPLASASAHTWRESARWPSRRASRERSIYPAATWRSPWRRRWAPADFILQAGWRNACRSAIFWVVAGSGR